MTSFVIVSLTPLWLALTAVLVGLTVGRRFARRARMEREAREASTTKTFDGCIRDSQIWRDHSKKTTDEQSSQYLIAAAATVEHLVNTLRTRK
jgi:hypothetical protein